MQPTFVPVAPRWWVGNLGGLLTNGIIARRRRSKLLGVVFGAGVLTHVVEAGYAYGLARRAGLEDAAWKWGLQTLGVGFPSLIALHELLEARAEAMVLEG